MPPPARELWVTGTTGYLGHVVAAELLRRRIPFRPLGRREGADLARPFELDFLFDRIFRSGVERTVIHLAAMSRFYECEEKADLAARINAEATGALAAALRRKGGRLVYVSTDLVFDGEHAPYDETAEPRPKTIYGRTKRLGELSTLAEPGNLVVRLPLLYGPSFDGRRGATDWIAWRIARGEKVVLFTDEWRTPLDVQTAAARLIELSLDPAAEGIRHIPGPERLSRYELGIRYVRNKGLDESLVEEGSRLDMPGTPRPKDVSLATLHDRDERAGDAVSGGRSAAGGR